MNTCPHKNIIGDNYGTSCRTCGMQLSGYGYGGFFGANLTGQETCVHQFSPMGEGGNEICVYCERIRDPKDDLVYVNPKNMESITKRLSGKQP